MVERLPFDPAGRAFLTGWLYGQTGNAFRHGRPEVTADEAERHSVLALLGVALALDALAGDHDTLDWIVERVPLAIPAGSEPAPN
jgi:hypothetical protein